MVTIGVKLYYGAMPENKTTADITKDTADEFAQGAVTQIVGVKTIPQLQAAPNAIDVTSLEDMEEQSEPGLISGSSLQITLNYKENVFKEDADFAGTDYQDGSNFERCLDLSQDDTVYVWKIVLPNGRYFVFLAKARTVTGEMALASALTFTLSLFKRSRVFTGMVPPPKADDGQGSTEGGTEAQSARVNTVLDSGIVKAAPRVIDTTTEEGVEEE